jgi:hypothetical protein
MGRPYKNGRTEKSLQINFRLSADEREVLEIGARRNNMKLSEYLIACGMAISVGAIVGDEIWIDRSKGLGEGTLWVRDISADNLGEGDS